MTNVLEKVDPQARARFQKRFQMIDGRVMRRLTRAGLTWLRTNQQQVNALNVFPVPDGDTGTNMVLTMQSAWDEIQAMDERDIGQVARAIAHGALMGARGNSGVILSQLWRGFARAIDGHQSMDARLMARALREARETAYKGVVRPVEGTILTVSTDVAEAAEEAVRAGATSALTVLEKVVEAADKSVKRTPDLLPVLKEAGVVDAGGMGFYYILEGMLRWTYGLPLDEPVATVQPLSALDLNNAMHAVEPGQDWEVVVDFRPNDDFDLQAFYRRLESMGTSIQVGEGDGIYRMHIHVPDRTEYEPIEFVKTLGTVTSISIENLMDQMEGQGGGAPEGQRVRFSPIEPGTIAAVAVAPGPGIGRVFASLGAAAIIHGGQTMNPSTQEILASFEDLPTDKVIILPNNKNILLAAQQAAELTVKQVEVVPSLTIPQGVAAMLCLDPEGDFEAVVKAMKEALSEVRSGEITVATRSVEIDGVQVRAGQIIGLADGRLAVAGDDLESVLLQVLKALQAQDYELITIYYGEDLTARQANALADRARKEFPQQEVEVVEGGQPHYRLIVSVE